VGVTGDFSQVAADQGQVMFRIDLPQRADSLRRCRIAVRRPA
jgi:hypothetical protein